MPRGRKPKVDLLLAPKEETKKVKSPWSKDEVTEDTNKEKPSLNKKLEKLTIEKTLYRVQFGKYGTLESYTLSLLPMGTIFTLKAEEGENGAVFYKLVYSEIETQEQFEARVKRELNEYERLKKIYGE